MKALLAVTLAGMFAISAHARLGLTLEECEKQYGNAVNEDMSLAATQGYEFVVGEYRLICYIPESKVVAIHYFKKNKGTFTEAEGADLLYKNAPGIKWGTATPDGDSYRNDSIRDSQHWDLYRCWIFLNRQQQAESIFITVTESTDITPGL